MKKRMISLLLMLCLWAAMLPAAYAETPEPEDSVRLEQIVAGCKSLYLALEGSYDSVVRCDYNALSIGFMQWHGNRALLLLKLICKTDPQRSQTVLGLSLYNSVVNAPDSGWNNYVPSAFEAESIRRLIGSDVGVACQESMARDDILIQIRHGRECGVRSVAGLIYYCSMENQYGVGGVQTAMRYVREALRAYWGLDETEPIESLELLHSAVQKAGESHSYIRNYLSVRNRAYDHLVRVLQLSAEGDADPFTGFVDLYELDRDRYDAVVWANTTSPQIINGINRTHFAPDASLTRAMAVTILWRANGKPEPACTENPFEDVLPGRYYRTAVLWAVGEGITVGTDSTHFTPERACSRAEILTMLYRSQASPAAEEVDLPFGDVAKTNYFYRPVCWAIQNGIAAGSGETEFSPKAVSPRVDIVLFLYRVMTGRGRLPLNTQES